MKPQLLLLVVPLWLICNVAKAAESLETQYEEAQAENKIVVFVRDNAGKRLMSFSLDNA